MQQTLQHTFDLRVIDLLHGQNQREREKKVKGDEREVEDDRECNDVTLRPAWGETDQLFELESLEVPAPIDRQPQSAQNTRFVSANQADAARWLTEVDRTAALT